MDNKTYLNQGEKKNLQVWKNAKMIKYWSYVKKEIKLKKLKLIQKQLLLYIKITKKISNNINSKDLTEYNNEGNSNSFKIIKLKSIKKFRWYLSWSFGTKN